VKPLRIIWSTQAKESLNEIYQFYLTKSPQGAQNVREDLLDSPKSIRFAKQYQVDEINPNFRRIVVRGFKVLYQEKKGDIRIIDVVSTRQSPDVFRDS
jgi:plasmid stabilization system protein ParE